MFDIDVFDLIDLSESIGNRAGLLGAQTSEIESVVQHPTDCPGHVQAVEGLIATVN